MLKRIRQIVACLSLVFCTLLFVDFTGTAQNWFGWIAKIQFLPALLALNAAVVIALLLLTVLFGRLYCSVICPLGIMQDCFAWFGKKAKHNRYGYSPAKNTLRYIMFVIMVAAILFGIHIIVALLAPYSAYGRIAESIIAPVWGWLNNVLALVAEKFDSYAFYSIDVWLKGWITLAVAVVTLIILFIFSWRNGRTYCNTICPVGTLLGFFSRFSILRPVIDVSKCNSCSLCARNCKSSCIDYKEHKIDYSRCVTCFDCMETCRKGAISYSWHRTPLVVEDNMQPVDSSRRKFLSVGATVVATAALKAQEKTVDGGLAVIVDKQKPRRITKIVPAGALSVKNLETHCTSCQLCVAECPNDVLRPSTDLDSLMQPESSYERGYCRPECTRCSNVCPTGAIQPITIAEKSSVQVGHAVWIMENCLPLTDGVKCGNCARHCPVGAITMVPCDSDDEEKPWMPAVNIERCIGCGACENLCPARPFSAIYVEGNLQHRLV